MSRTTTLDWERLIRDTRSYLWMDEDPDDPRPVPVNELKETALAVGYSAVKFEAALDGTSRVVVRDGEAMLSSEVSEEAEAGAETASSESGGSTPADKSKYRRLYEAAADKAGRETWEVVEEEYIREAFAEEGFASLVDSNALHDNSEWRVVDFADADDEEPDWRYYCPTGSEPRPDEFKRFIDLLLAHAPDGYEPHLFRVGAAGKAPATEFGSWKAQFNRITPEEAVEWMENGGNVGVAGMPDDPLVNVDIDDDERTTVDDLKPTLRARSRSRGGFHGWYFDETGEIPNIPTDTAGEVRVKGQYVVAPGSFVASAGEEIADNASHPGYYTVEEEARVAPIEYDELPEVFREFNEQTADDEDDLDPEDVTTSSPIEAGEDDGRDRDSGSAVFDIDASDLVAGKDASDRWTSIFHGSSTSANMSLSDEGHLHCWRHNVTHGGLQALAVLSELSGSGDTECQHIGTGHSKSGSGPNRLKGDWRLVWYAWHEAKQRRLIPDDDPVPYRVIVNLAVADGLVDEDDLVERESDDGGSYTGLPDADAYNAVLDHIETEYGVETGRDPYETDDGEAVSALPLGRLDALDPSEARRYAKDRGVEWPTTREARSRLRDRVMQAFRAKQTVVIEAPTALGKSYTVASEPWMDRASSTDEHPVVQFSETREARDAAAQASSDTDVTYATLKGRSEACPVAAGRHDVPDEEDGHDGQVITLDGRNASEWLDSVCDGRGVPFSVAHQYLQQNNDQSADLPCCDGETAECPAIAQWNGLPRDDDGNAAVDVIHATHQFAYVPSLVNYSNVVFDECPDFGADLPQDRIQRAVSAFLEEVGAPMRTWESFVQAARYDGDTSDMRGNAYVRERAETADRLDHDPDREWYLTNPDAHTLAPALARSIWRALASEADANGRYMGESSHDPPRLDATANDSDSWNRTWVTVVVDEDNRVQTVRHSPDLRGARAVVGLDAHPTAFLWARNATDKALPRPLLTDDERTLWRRYERGLTVVQVGDATRSLTTGAARMNEEKFSALVGHLSEHYGEEFGTCITSARAEQRASKLMEEAGVADPETMHFGEEKSRNDFGDENVGFVNGCIDPGDDYVINLLAECELDAVPETQTTEDGEEERAWGRGFEGRDASAAAALLASVRENHVAQAAGRYARNADDPDDTATVYVRTDAIPEGFADLKVPGVTWVAGDKQREIIEALRDRESATAQEIAEDVDATERHIRDTLSNLADDGVIECAEGEGHWGANLYHALAGLGDSTVDVGPIPSAEEETDVRLPRQGEDTGNVSYAPRVTSAQRQTEGPPPRIPTN